MQRLLFMMSVVLMACGIGCRSPGDDQIIPSATANDAPAVAVRSDFLSPEWRDGFPATVHGNDVCPSGDEPGWHECVVDWSSVSTRATEGDHDIGDFSSILQRIWEVPFDTAVTTLPDGRNVVVGTEFMVTRGLSCVIVDGAVPVGCPLGWFAELEGLYLFRNPLFGELDGIPGIDLLVFEIGEDPWDVVESLASAIVRGMPAPVVSLVPHQFSWRESDSRWIDVTAERGLVPVAVGGCLPIGVEALDVDSDGGLDVFFRTSGAHLCTPSTPAWRWATDAWVADDTLLPSTLLASMYGVFSGPANDAGERDFVAVATEYLSTRPSSTASTCVHGTTFAAATPWPCPESLYYASPMGYAVLDLHRDGYPDTLVSDIGAVGYCDNIGDPARLENCFATTTFPASPTIADPNVVQISWAVTGSDLNGDGWADVGLTGSWHDNTLDGSNGSPWEGGGHGVQNLELYLNDGAGNPVRFHSSLWDAQGQWRTLAVFAPRGRDVSPTLVFGAFNRLSPDRIIGYGVAQEHVQLISHTGQQACDAYVRAFLPDAGVTLLRAACTGGYGGFNPAAVWLPPGTKTIEITWTDGRRTVHHADRADFPAVIVQ